eukprot:3364722-Rhodomonas_salina.2
MDNDATRSVQSEVESTEPDDATTLASVADREEETEVVRPSRQQRGKSRRRSSVQLQPLAAGAIAFQMTRMHPMRMMMTTIIIMILPMPVIMGRMMASGCFMITPTAPPTTDANDSDHHDESKAC